MWTLIANKILSTKQLLPGGRSRVCMPQLHVHESGGGSFDFKVQARHTYTVVTLKEALTFLSKSTRSSYFNISSSMGQHAKCNTPACLEYTYPTRIHLALLTLRAYLVCQPPDDFSQLQLPPRFTQGSCNTWFNMFQVQGLSLNAFFSCSTFGLAPEDPRSKGVLAVEGSQ